MCGFDLLYGWVAGADRLKLGKREGVLDVNGEGFLFILCGNKGGFACVELLGKERGFKIQFFYFQLILSFLQPSPLILYDINVQFF